MRHIALILSMTIAGASVPVFSAVPVSGPALMDLLRQDQEKRLAVRASASSASSSVSGRQALPPSVMDRPANIRVFAQSSSSVPRVVSYVRGGTVLSGSYDKRFICSTHVFADDCLSAFRPVGPSGLRVLRSR